MVRDILVSLSLTVFIHGYPQDIFLMVVVTILWFHLDPAVRTSFIAVSVPGHMYHWLFSLK